MSIQFQIEELPDYLAARFTGVGAAEEIWQRFGFVGERCKRANKNKLLLDIWEAEWEGTLASRFLLGDESEVFLDYKLIKFTPEGGRIWVELRRGDTGVHFVVRDTGQGIAPDLLPYVFDRFKQGDASAARRFGGLGLGLALAKHLVELHGGAVSVESPGEGRGATFTVNMPICAVRGDSETDGRRDGKAAPAQITRRPRAPMLEGVRALVVDDEADARELLAATLEMHGVLVTSADSADAALAEIEARLGDSEAEPFNVLISDIGMPGADGYELIRRVRGARTNA
jgi:hypothetical protein